MISDTLSAIPSLYFIAAGVFFFAGTIKGVLGIGLPTTALALLTLVVSPLEAIGLNLIPMIATNFYQFVSAQNITSIIRTYYRFALIMSAMLMITALLASSFGNDFIKLMISVSILSFCANNLFFRKWRMREAYDHFWQYSLGCASGLIGGLTSAWGVPITMYLVMKNVSPRQFVDISGFLIIVGCIPVTIGYVANRCFYPKPFNPGSYRRWCRAGWFQMRGIFARPDRTGSVSETRLMDVFCYGPQNGLFCVVLIRYFVRGGLNNECARLVSSAASLLYLGLFFLYRRGRASLS